MATANSPTNQETTFEAESKGNLFNSHIHIVHVNYIYNLNKILREEENSSSPVADDESGIPSTSETSSSQNPTKEARALELAFDSS